MSGRILIADDDDVLSEMLVDYLATEGFEVTRASDGGQALDKVVSDSPELVVLDIMMPKLNGIEVLKAIRKDSPVPVIMLTARGDDLDRILGLELGADDYLPKPCNPRELVARIRAILRRTEATSPGSVNRGLSISDLELIEDTRQVKVHGPEETREASLTQTEFDILQLLLSRPGQVVKKSDLSHKILGKPLGQWDRSIDVHISNLRKKLGPDDQGRERIRTIRGSGYLFNLESSSP